MRHVVLLVGKADLSELWLLGNFPVEFSFPVEKLGLRNLVLQAPGMNGETTGLLCLKVFSSELGFYLIIIHKRNLLSFVFELKEGYHRFM